jgi:hypothetical protein
MDERPNKFLIGYRGGSRGRKVVRKKVVGTDTDDMWSL